MFILNNMHGRQHHKEYKTDEGQSRAFFDLDESQINSSKNSEWGFMKVGDFACPVIMSRKMSTIYLIDSIKEEADIHGDKGWVVRGKVVGKFEDENEYIDTLNIYNVTHEKLKGNKFSIGFNVANLDEQLDAVKVNNTIVPARTFGELREKIRNDI